MNSLFKGKYTSWADLFMAFRLGEIPKDHWAVFIDNDYAALHYTGPINDFADEDTRYEEGRQLFYYDGPVNMQDVFEAFDIPAMSA